MTSPAQCNDERDQCRADQQIGQCEHGRAAADEKPVGTGCGDEKDNSPGSHVGTLARMYLHELPADHPDRNRPLVGVFYRWKHGTAWREVLPSYAIANSTYNDLGPAWTDSDYWSVTREQ